MVLINPKADSSLPLVIHSVNEMWKQEEDFSRALRAVWAWQQWPCLSRTERAPTQWPILLFNRLLKFHLLPLPLVLLQLGAKTLGGKTAAGITFPLFFRKGRDSCSVRQSRDSTTAHLGPDPAPVKISGKIPPGFNRQLKEAASGSSLQSNNTVSKCWKQLERKKRVGRHLSQSWLADLPAISKYKHSASQCFTWGTG